MNLNKTMYGRFNQNNKKISLRTSKNHLNKFIDFNKNNRIFYDNVYLNDIQFVIKIPLQDSRKKRLKNNIRIEKFNLTDSIYIFNYE